MSTRDRVLQMLTALGIEDAEYAAQRLAEILMEPDADVINAMREALQDDERRHQWQAGVWVSLMPEREAPGG